MSNEVCFLITVYYKAIEATLQCALKVKRDKLTGDCEDYPMEPENRAQLYALLPDNVRSEGPIIAVDKIFEVHTP